MFCDHHKQLAFRFLTISVAECLTLTSFYPLFISSSFFSFLCLEMHLTYNLLNLFHAPKAQFSNAQRWRGKHFLASKTILQIRRGVSLLGLVRIAAIGLALAVTTAQDKQMSSFLTSKTHFR